MLTSSTCQLSDETLLTEIQQLIRKQVGAIAALGGMIRTQATAAPIIPKTRSGKTLRRVLRELLENGVRGEFEREVNVPSTVEDLGVVETARGAVRGYFEKGGRVHGTIDEKAKL